MKLLADLIRTSRFESPRDLGVALVVVGAAVPEAVRQMAFPFEVGLVATSGALALTTAIWLWRRWLPTFVENEVGILISFAPVGSIADTERVRNVLASLRSQLRDELAKLPRPSTGARFVLREVPEHLRPSSFDDADQLLTAKEGTLIIWARVEAGTRASRSGLDFRGVQTIVRHNRLSSAARPKFRAELPQVWDAQPSRTISLDNDIDDTRLIVEHLSLVAKYQVGLAAAASGWRDVGLPLLRTAMGEGKARLPYQKAARSAFAQLQVLPWQMEWPLPGASTERLTEGRDAASTAVEMCHDSVAARLVLANVLFLLGDIRGASNQNDLVKPYLRENEAIFYLNRAAFALAREQFDEAVANYRRAVATPFDPVSAASASRWLEAAVNEIGIQFELGLAVLNDYFMDRALAADLYTKTLVWLPPGKARAWVSGRIAVSRNIPLTPTSAKLPA